MVCAITHTGQSGDEPLEQGPCLCPQPFVGSVRICLGRLTRHPMSADVFSAHAHTHTHHCCHGYVRGGGGWLRAVQKRGRFVVFDGTSAPDLTMYINTDGATTLFHATITVTTKVPRAHLTPCAALF